VSWENPRDRVVVGPYLLLEMEEKMVKIRKNLKFSQDKKKSCADKGRTQRDYKVGDHVLLKVKSRHSSLKLVNCSNLPTIYCGSFQIL
jgi:hypothetical protein